jgi:hypothetical protein
MSFHVKGWDCVALVVVVEEEEEGKGAMRKGSWTVEELWPHDLF